MIFQNTNCDIQLTLSVEERLENVERRISALSENVEKLQQMLKEQRQLIREYITSQIVSSNNLENENLRPEDAIYTFVCKQQFAKYEKEIEKLKKAVSSLGSEQ